MTSEGLASNRVLLVLLVAVFGLLVGLGLVDEDNAIVAGLGWAGALLSGVAAVGGVLHLWQRGSAADPD